MSILSVFSNKSGVEDAVNNIYSQLSGMDVKVLVYFASSCYEPEQVSKLVHEKFIGTLTFGCSTAGELSNNKMLKNSLVAMAFSSEEISDAKLEVIEDIKGEMNIKKAFKSLETYFNQPIMDLDFEKYLGLVLIDGMSASEEKLMDKLGDMTNIVFIGGSAGDDLKFQRTYVYANGEVYENAAAIVLLKPAKGFDFIKTQSFYTLEKKLTATKVNEENREVIEFNNKSAVEAYAEALGVPKQDLGKYFMSNPVGLVSDGEIFVRSPQQIKGESIIFYCSILEGMEVSLLQSTDIVEDTKKALESKVKEVGTVSGIINFNCILRTLGLEQEGKTEDYGKVFTGIPTVGFSTYGEEFVGHINQTATMVVFK